MCVWGGGGGGGTRMHGCVDVGVFVCIHVEYVYMQSLLQYIPLRLGDPLVTK